MKNLCHPYPGRVRRSSLFCAVFIFLCFFASAQDRGLAVVARSVGGDDVKIGKQYAVLIAIDNYQEWNSLKNPVKDALEIKEILKRRYYIDEFMELYDRDATAKGIRLLLADLVKRVGKDDSVFIYYAGHGVLDENSKTGSWIASDGVKDTASQNGWIPNSQIRAFMTEMKARSVALFADSCFSGDLLNVNRGASPTINTAYLKAALQLTSREVISAGASETVPDNSEFSSQLKAILDRNSEACLDSETMYINIRKGVTQTRPLKGNLAPGHQEGGSFVLFLREGLSGGTVVGPSIELYNLPPSATVLISGKNTERNLTASDGKLVESVQIGSYSVSVMHPLWKEVYTTTIQVGSETAYRHLVPSGRIAVKSVPAAATVTLDGNAVELDPERGETPPLIAGTYKLKVTAPYMSEYAEAVKVTAGQVSMALVRNSPVGVLELKTQQSDVVVEVRGSDGEARSPSTALRYDLGGGEYLVKAKLADDIDWSWMAKVKVSIGSTTRLPLPPEAYGRSMAWQIQEEGKNADTLKARHEVAVAKQRRIMPIAIGSLAAGGASGLGAGLFLFLGNSAMDSYNGSTTEQEAADWRSKVETYDILAIASAAFSAVGLGTGGVLLATVPKPGVIEAQVQASLDRLLELEARKVAQEVER